MSSPYPTLKHALTVVTPLRRGTTVRRVQELLIQNRFGNFDPGHVDGEWGEQSAAATRRAQYWTGRKASSIDGVMHQQLVEQLGGVRLTPLQHTRRVKRVLERKLQRRRDVGKRALKVALTQVGVKENPPNSNRGAKVDQYEKSTGAIGEPWCASFASWCLDQAGWHRDPTHVNWAYCPSILAAARAGVAGLSVTTQPRPGDLVLYDWDGDGLADHIEWFDGWISHGSSFGSVGGNTSPTNASNGGQVYHYPGTGVPPRTVSVVAAFVRVHPTPEGAHR